MMYLRNKCNNYMWAYWQNSRYEASLQFRRSHADNENAFFSLTNVDSLFNHPDLTHSNEVTCNRRANSVPSEAGISMCMPLYSRYYVAL